MESWRMAYFQWLVLVPVKGGIGGIVHSPIGSIYHLYTTYIPLIYCLLGGYMLTTTTYGNQKQPLIFGGNLRVYTPENEHVYPK